MRHTAVTFGDKMYLFGGNQQSLKSSNELWSFDYNENVWEFIQPLEGSSMPPTIGSHSAIIHNENECMYIFGGFSDSKNEGYQNKVWKYHFVKQEWTVLGENSTVYPCKRAGSSITLIKSTLYMFGGINSTEGGVDKMYIFN